MAGTHEDTIREAFRTQAEFCRRAGSPFTGRICDTLAGTLDRTTRTGAAILDWPGAPMVDALMLRIAGGLHALARGGTDPELSALYQEREGDFAGILARVLGEHDAALLGWLDGPPQTNEVARAGALWPGIMAVAARFGPRVELIELGPSAGLNLNMDRFGYHLGGVRAGDPGSPLQLAPEWIGPPPPFAEVEVVSRIGIDRNPLDVSDPAVAERLIAYAWPDQPLRVSRIEAAIELARSFPPPIAHGDAALWLAARLALPRDESVSRIVYHSIVLQYLPPEGREQVRAAIAEAGGRASAARPFAWLSMEFHEQVATAELRLTIWPGGEMKLIGRVHPHGATVEWLDV